MKTDLIVRIDVVNLHDPNRTDMKKQLTRR